MRAWLAILFSLLATCAVAGFNDFNLGGLSLTGGGQCQEQRPVLDISPSSYTFANTTTGKSRSALFTVTNTGKGILSNISTSKSSGVFKTYTAVGFSCNGKALYTGNYCKFKVEYKPIAATLSRYSSMVSTGQFAARHVPVQGTGIQTINVLSYFNANSATTGQSLQKGSGTLTIGASVSATTGAVGNGLASSTGNSAGRVTYSQASGNIDQAIGTLGMYVKFTSPPSVNGAKLLNISGTANQLFWFGYVTGPYYRFAYRATTCDLAMSNFHTDGSQFDFIELAWTATGNNMGYRVNNSAWSECSNTTGSTPASTAIQLINTDGNINPVVIDQIIISSGYKDDLYSVRNSTSF